jgi:PRTRC genetic system protein E
MFSALLPLLETATVTLIVTRLGESPPTLRITVIPKPNDAKADKTLFRPFNVEATLDELEHPEEGFAKLLKAERQSRHGVEAAITDLKEADTAAAEAKKEEAKRKRNETKATSKPAAEKKEEEETPPMPSLFGGSDEDTNG